MVNFRIYRGKTTDQTAMSTFTAEEEYEKFQHHYVRVRMLGYLQARFSTKGLNEE